MKLVERYVFSRAMKVSASALAVALGIAWTTQALSRINLVTDSGQTAMTFFEVATLLLPTVVGVVTPFALIIGVTQTLAAMNQDSELAVISASGTSRWTIVKPVLILALLASALSFFVDNAIEPAARQRVRDIVANANADILASVIEEGSFRKIQDGLFVQVSERLPDGRLGGIFVADSRTKNVDLAFYAKNGEIYSEGSDRVLFMRDGEVHRKTPGGDVSVIKFVSYAFDLSEFKAKSDSVFLYPKDRTLGYLLEPDPGDNIYQQVPLLYVAELHRRLTDWTYSIVFALIALAAAGDVRSHRQARIHPMVAAVAYALLVRWEGYFLADKVEDSRAFIPLVYAVPLGNSLFALYFVVTGRLLELPASWADTLGNRVASLGAWSRRMIGRLNPLRPMEGRP